VFEQHGVKVNTRFRKILFTGKLKTLSGFLKFIHRSIGLSEKKSQGMKF
jgi:hypothetical protein